jgi:histone-lysine N-methyltransferase SETMAR
MWCIAAKFVPRLLRNDQKEHHIAICSELKEQTENDPNFISTIINVDESWVYGYDRDEAAIISMENAKFTMAQESTSLKQCQINVDLFDTEGIVHKEFVPPGQTVNGNFYCDVLRRLRENVWRKRPVKWLNNSWALHHDNMPAHTSGLVGQFLTSTKTTVTPHTPYSPDLAPCDFFLFPKMK